MQSSIIAKLLTLLTVISETKTPLTFSDLVRESGLNKSTIHRLLAIAMEEGLVQYDRHRKVYLLGSKLFDLVRSSYSGHDIQMVAHDEMIRLHSLFDGNVTLGIPSGMEVVYLRILEAQFAMSAFQLPGTREMMHCSASGKALLAFLPDKLVDAKLSGYEFERFTERTITDAESFKAALAEVRRDGYAANDREEYDHFVGIAAPIFNYIGEPVAVLNIWTAHVHHPIEEVRGWSDELLVSAARVTSLIGGLAPDPEFLGAA